MIVLIDNHDANTLINKLVELYYGFDTWNYIVRETIISTIEHMGNTETETDHRKLVNCIYDLEDGAADEILPLLEEYGFMMEEF